jgi:MazG family protein
MTARGKRVDSLPWRRYRRPMIDARVADTFTRLVEIVARLRAPDGCPWDREQTPESLRPYLLEEAYEVLDALDRGEPEAVREELGDLLLQVVLQSQLATEAGRFTVADVARGIAEKLVHRHPHVFGDVAVRDAKDVARNWSRQKAEERRRAGEDALFGGVPVALPALARAQKLGDKARHLGVDWPSLEGVLEKVREETGELEAAITAGDRAGIEDELGDLLLTITSLARHLEVAAEVALRSASDRFVSRVRRVEAAARERGVALTELGPEELDRLWTDAKRTAGPA